MANINLSLSAKMKAWIEAQSDAGAYRDANDYIRKLISRDQQRVAKIAAMQQLVDEGRASGDYAGSAADLWQAAIR